MARSRRKVKATFDLNLAPILDIIVSIIPMLLLSVAFIQVKMIETPIPQVVAEKIAEQKAKDTVPVTIELKADKEFLAFNVVDRGTPREIKIPAVNGKVDFAGLYTQAVNLKRQYSDVFKVDLAPASTVTFDDIVQIMDTLRRGQTNEKKFAFKDTKTGEMVETDFMFTDVTFSNVVGQ